MGKLHEAVAAYRQKFGNWKQAFDATDASRNGYIDFQALAEMLGSLELKLGDPLVKEIFHACDLNKDGMIQPHEFASVLWDGGLPISTFAVGWKSTTTMLHKLHEAVCAYHNRFMTWQHAFESTDTNKNGCIELAELTTMLASLNMNLDDRVVEEMFHICDFNKDGKIQPQEFASVLWEGRFAEGSKITTTMLKKLTEAVAAYHDKFKNWQNAFEATDADRNGCIDFQELMTMLDSLDLNLEDGLAKEIFHTCDFSKDGIIQPHEFASVLWEGRLLISTFGESSKCEDDADDPPGICTRYDPGIVLVDLTMPRYEWTALAFAIVVLWVAFYTYIMVDAANRFGCTINVPHVVMGQIVLAAGTSVPDMIASISVARDGFADMAAASAVGSNTFDILLGLGLPWLIRGLMGKEIDVPVDELVESIAILAGALCAYLIILHLNRWVLNRAIGGFMLAVYAASVFYIDQALHTLPPLGLVPSAFSMQRCALHFCLYSSIPLASGPGPGGAAPLWLDQRTRTAPGSLFLSAALLPPPCLWQSQH